MNHPVGESPAGHALPGVWGVVLQIYLGCVLAGCSQPAEEVAAAVREPAEVIVEPVQLTLQAGGEAWLSAQANDASGQPIGGASFRFTPADAAVLKVSGQGLVTALGPVNAGTAVLVASGSRERRVQVVVVPGPPQRIEKMSGDGQQVAAGEPPAEPLAVNLLDGWGNRLASQPLEMTSVGDVFPAAQVVTDAEGQARFEVPRLTVAGATMVLIRAPTSDLVADSFQLQIVPGPPADVKLVPADGGDSLPPAAQPRLTLLVVDAFGNPVPDVELGARLGTDDVPPTMLRADATGRALFLLPAAGAAGPMNLDVEVTATPTIRRTFTVDLPANPPAG